MISHTTSTIVARHTMAGPAEHLKGLSPEPRGTTPTVASDGTDVISHTTSTIVARHITAGPAEHLKGLSPEPGGTTPTVVSGDAYRVLRVGRELEVGTVWPKVFAVIVDQMEEGGFKQSGVGRLNGERALAEFQEIKHVVHPAPVS